MFVSGFPRLRLAGAAIAVLLGCASPALAQVEPCPAAINQPPLDSPLLFRCMSLVAHPINETTIDQNTYDYYIKTPRTVTRDMKFVPYDEDSLQADFYRLWGTNFLDNLWIEVVDEAFENGVKAKHVIFHIEERSRVKAVDYLAKEGSKTTVDISKIEDTLRTKNIHVNLDTFVDEATIRKVKGVIREIYSDKGYNDVRIETTMKALPAGPKLVHLSFFIDQGPRYKLADVVFDGNHAFSDATLRSQMKNNKAKAWWSFFTSGGTYLDAKFADDADKVTEYYLNHGYVRAQVGQPKIETLRDSRDGKNRFIRVRVPVDEGMRYKVGTFTVVDNTAVRTEALRSMFKLAEGDYYSFEKMQKGAEKAQELYGRIGFWQMTPEPLAIPRGIDPETGQPIGPDPLPPIVDVTIKVIEGKQFYVNRITFTGNTTTHDGVARRELRVYEGGVFDTGALKESVRRLNQLGYFKPLEGREDEVSIQPTPGRDGLVDIKLKFEEQNRNQISFGAGVSQFDGFFGQLSYQTANFLGRGEVLGVSLQKGSRAQQYQVSFSEPYLFDRPITAGAEVYSRQFVYPYQFTQQSTGGNVIVGWPLGRNLRFFTGYGYERTRVYDIAEAYLDSNNPVLRDSLLLDAGGIRTVGKVTPQLIYNTINTPVFPTSGVRYTGTVDIAGIGGNTEYARVRGEGIWYIPIGSKPLPRFAFGIRAEGQWISPRGSTVSLPIFEKFFLGGEFSVRGFDMRSIGPRDPLSGVVTGGNKTLLLNAEFYIVVAGPVRIVGFYDAGQVRDTGESFVWREAITVPNDPPRGLLYDPFAPLIVTEEPFVPSRKILGYQPAFKTSTGVELRFFMPVLNVPFRLIAAYNPSRFGVLNNNLQATKQFTFRFAVGTTF
jgi:outer membrane protein insertion porin family